LAKQYQPGLAQQAFENVDKMKGNNISGFAGVVIAWLAVRNVLRVQIFSRASVRKHSLANAGRLRRRPDSAGQPAGFN
jgi:hypothetical protein